MPLAKKTIYRFTNQALRFLHRYPNKMHVTKFQRSGRYITEGECESGTNEITIDYRSELLPTLVHELLHAFHPNWKECQVRRMEKGIVNGLSQSQVVHLLKAFAKCL